MTNKEKIWAKLISLGMTAAGAAGMMGNLYAESALEPKNLQNSYEKKLGYTDAAYTKAVDCGEYADFASDCAGYGLAQWTYHSRKTALLAYAKNCGKSIGDLEMQLDFLRYELEHDYPNLFVTLRITQDVHEASNAVMLNFERPADTSEAARAKRAEYAQAFYDEFAEAEQEEAEQDKPEPFLVRIICHALNVRSGAGLHHPVKQVVKCGEVFTIVETAEVSGATWGRLKSGAGWINVTSKYCKRV